MKKLPALVAASLFLAVPARTETINVTPAASGGGSSGLTVGTTTISGGTNGNCLYDHSGVLGEQSCSASTISIGSTITGATNGYGLYVGTGGSAGLLEQFAYGTGVFTALGDAVDTNGGFVTASTASIASGAILTGGGSGSAISGITPGTGVATALAQNLNGSGAIAATTSPSFVTPALGTPASGTLTNTTGFPAANLAAGAIPSSATVNNANWSGTVLSVANGGTGTSSPGLVAGTNVTISGTWPNQTINASGGGSGGNPGPYTVGTAITGTGTISALNKTYCVNLSGAATLTLPASPSTGDRIVLKDCTGALTATIAATVQSNATPSSYNLDGQSTFVMNTAYQENAFWFNGSTWAVE